MKLVTHKQRLKFIDELRELGFFDSRLLWLADVDTTKFKTLPRLSIVNDDDVYECFCALHRELIFCLQKWRRQLKHMTNTDSKFDICWKLLDDLVELCGVKNLERQLGIPKRTLYDYAHKNKDRMRVATCQKMADAVAANLPIWLDKLNKTLTRYSDYPRRVL